MKKHKTRLDYNRNILQILTTFIESNPDMRFHQALNNLGLDSITIDNFYEESKDTHERLKTKLKR